MVSLSNLKISIYIISIISILYISICFKGFSDSKPSLLLLSANYFNYLVRIDCLFLTIGNIFLEQIGNWFYPLDMNIQRELKNRLKKTGMSQAEAAKEIGVSERMMRYYLSETNPIDMKKPVRKAFDQLIEKKSWINGYKSEVKTH